MFDVGIDYPEDPLLTLGSFQHLAFSHSFANIQNVVPNVGFREGCDVFISSEEIVNSLDNFSDEEVLDTFDWLRLHFGGLVIVLSVREQRALAESLVREYAEGAGFYGLREFLPKYRERVSRLLRLAVTFPLAVVDIEKKPLDMTLSSYYIYVATGRKVVLPEIVANATKNKRVMQFFLSPFRGFYSSLHSTHKCNR
ncbi:MAG: hypothetical protein PSV18_13095 [Methylobacter sp.]|nr:hypothetical protein [Candidatus Methylobacter titanis]